MAEVKHDVHFRQGIQIPIKRKRQKYNDDGNNDRLSDLPDCVLLQILFFLSTELAVRTCMLSTRWKTLWKRIQSFIISYSQSQYRYIDDDVFMSRFFSLRDQSTALQVLDFSSDGCIWTLCQLQKILGYNASHNVQQLRINVEEIQDFPSWLFSCHNLISLHLSIAVRYNRNLFPNSLNFPALTSLSLQSFKFNVGNDGRVEPFSTFSRLNSLIIRDCAGLNKQNICISSVTLVNLTIYDCNFELYTPSLCTFVYEGYPTVEQLCGSKSNLASIKHVNIKVGDSFSVKTTPLVLRNWLLELANIESLTICSNALKVLYLVPDILKMEFPSLCNLKSLKVKLYQSLLPCKYLDFFLQKAPSAKIDFIRFLRDQNQVHVTAKVIDVGFTEEEEKKESSFPK